jgi:hypothetical protein
MRGYTDHENLAFAARGAPSGIGRMSDAPSGPFDTPDDLAGQ